MRYLLRCVKEQKRFSIYYWIGMLIVYGFSVYNSFVDGEYVNEIESFTEMTIEFSILVIFFYLLLIILKDKSITQNPNSNWWS